MLKGPGENTVMPMKVMYCDCDHYTIRRPIINQDWQLIPTTSVYEALSCKTLGTFANKPEHAETVLLNSSVVCMHATATDLE